MNMYLLAQVEQMLEQMRAEIKKSVKNSESELLKSEEAMAAYFDATLYMAGAKIVSQIKSQWGLSKQEAESILGEAKANIYDKYSKKTIKD